MDKEMVTFGTITELKNKYAGEKEEAIVFGAKCYEEGMIEVLRDVASEDLEDIHQVELSEFIKGLYIESEKKLQALKETLDQHQLDLLSEYTEKTESIVSSEGGEHYIEGFVRGYRYLKNKTIF